MEHLGTRGFRDRKSGAFVVSGVDEDSKEPERTERILAAPFTLHRAKLIDAFQSREGFFMFRVHGATRFGRWYRLIVIVANMIFGLLAGLQPLVQQVGPAMGFAQTGLVCLLQLSMGLLCFRFLPDADRIISRFVATQFCLEGLSTASLLGASISEHVATGAAGAGAGPANAADTAVGVASDAETVGSLGGIAAAAFLLLRDSGFYLALAAMLVPMLQLLEQRAITPCINLVKNRGGNPLALLAAAYMLATSLPKKVLNMVRHWMGYEDLASGKATTTASADAGEDAMVSEAIEAEADRDCGGGEEGEQRQEEGEPCQAADPSLLTGEQVADAAVRASRLLARALAAKEASGKAIVKKQASSEAIVKPKSLSPTHEEEEAAIPGPEYEGSTTFVGLRAAARLRAQREARRRASTKVDEDAAEDGDDGGGDD